MTIRIWATRSHEVICDSCGLVRVCSSNPEALRLVNQHRKEHHA